jgi:hypothetical protein
MINGGAKVELEFAWGLSRVLSSFPPAIISLTSREEENQMRILQLSAKADPGGIIHLEIPLGAANEEFELAIVVSPKQNANGTISPKTPEELGYPPGFFENVIGSIDDETFCEPPDSPPTPVASLD